MHDQQNRFGESGIDQALIDFRGKSKIKIILGNVSRTGRAERFRSVPHIEEQAQL